MSKLTTLRISDDNLEMIEQFKKDQFEKLGIKCSTSSIVNGALMNYLYVYLKYTKTSELLNGKSRD